VGIPAERKMPATRPVTRGVPSAETNAAIRVMTSELFIDLRGADISLYNSQLAAGAKSRKDSAQIALPHVARDDFAAYCSVVGGQIEIAPFV
jgi:hypothetical protein